VPELQSKVTFKWLNLKNKKYKLSKDFDLIFCRNVMIYFDRPTQQTILHHLTEHLKPEGYLFIGASEGVSGLDLPVSRIIRTVYQKSKMKMDTPELPVIDLKPAQMYMTDKPAIVKTLLGSCVAVTMFNRRLGVGAICHALLPHPLNGEPQNNKNTENYRYVNRVIPEMVRKMELYGVQPKEIEVKLFGGARMLAPITGTQNFRPIGNLNIKMARQLIDDEKLQLKASEVGGEYGRKILFHTHTGDVFLQRINLLSRSM
jgi:chemotaxis protein CheD